jgi:hypothetical protein
MAGVSYGGGSVRMEAFDDAFRWPLLLGSAVAMVSAGVAWLAMRPRSEDSAALA